MYRIKRIFDKGEKMSQKTFQLENALETGVLDTIGRIVPMKQHCCLRCDHIWIARNPEVVPVSCANKKCRSPLWNTPRAYRKIGKPEPTRQPSKRNRRKLVEA